MASSAVIKKKAGFIDTAFDHKLHDALEDDTFLGGEDDSSDEDNEKPETKDQYFEFSDSYSVMRVIKCLFFVQILALLIDNPSIELTKVFEILNRGILYYSMRFYSQIIIDIIYLLQSFYGIIVHLISDISSSAPENANSIGIASHKTTELLNTTLTNPFNYTSITHGRKLNTNPYLDEDSAPDGELSMDIDFLEDKNWHAVKHFSEYLLGDYAAELALHMNLL
jgi:hypothetical protein